MKIQQQSRTISDLEFKEKELNDLLSKKQKCHHKEFDRTNSELQSEIEFFREISMKSEKELRLLENRFAEFKGKIMLKINSPQSEIISEEDSGIFSKSPNNHDTSSESLTVPNHSQVGKKKRGKKKRR